VAEAAPVAREASSTQAKVQLEDQTLRELARTKARRKLLRRAQLRGSFQTLGVLGTVGFAVAVILGVSAIVLGAKSMFRPTQTRADVVQVMGARDIAVKH
jgi:hypothetical protein